MCSAAASQINYRLTSQSTRNLVLHVTEEMLRMFRSLLRFTTCTDIHPNVAKHQRVVSLLFPVTTENCRIRKTWQKSSVAVAK